eukprot:393373-Rhodomonas_salina.2
MHPQTSSGAHIIRTVSSAYFHQHTFIGAVSSADDDDDDGVSRNKFKAAVLSASESSVELTERVASA